jgi:excisionase family DNA binding protein
MPRLSDMERDGAALPDLLKPREVADLLRVDETTVLRWVKDREVEASRLPGGTYRIPRSEVERILATPAVPAA